MDEGEGERRGERGEEGKEGAGQWAAEVEARGEESDAPRDDTRLLMT
jgi:hypothetical protein